jgi:hypothetical protein
MVELLPALDKLDPVAGGTVLAWLAGAGAVVVRSQAVEFTGRRHLRKKKKKNFLDHQSWTYGHI